MKANYHFYQGKQDLTRRIKLLHRQQNLSIGVVGVTDQVEAEKALKHYNKLADEIPIYFIGEENQFNYESLSAKYPKVNYIMFNEVAPFALMANTFANECRTTYFLLSRSDVVFEKLSLEKAISLFKLETKSSCVVPSFKNKIDEVLPTLFVPYLNKETIEPLPFSPTNQINQTLYPFFGVGLYERALFQRLRGFDQQIEGLWWQLLDFGIKSWLYGYPILNLNSMEAKFFSRQLVIEDRSATNTIKRSLTKALGVKKVGSKFVVTRPKKYYDSVTFKEIKQRLVLYKTDLNELIDNWRVVDD
ncbi:MAG: hypothetical protein ACOXZZ_01505 [Sphaerochaetaceae bacterium]|jgi:hypothetical protein